MTTTDDIITKDEIHGMLEPIQHKNRQFRRAYRVHDATGIDSNSFTFPEYGNHFEGEAVAVGEGEQYPRASLSFGDTQANYVKYGFEHAFTDEAQDDSAFELQANGLRQQMEEEERKMDELAFQVLNNNHRTDAVGPDTPSGDLSTSNVHAARSLLFADGYNISEAELYVGPDSMGDILDELGERATDLGDSIHTSGQLPGGEANEGYLGTYAGMPVFATNTANLGDGEALLVDTSSYGYESRRWDVETEVYREERTDETVAKVRSRLDFVCTDPDAAIKIEA